VKATGDGGWIKADDFPRLVNRLAERQSTNLEYEQAVSKFTDPGYRFDPTSPDDQRAVDLLHERNRAGNADGASAFLQRVAAPSGMPLAAVSEATTGQAATADTLEGFPIETGDGDAASIGELPVEAAFPEGPEIAQTDDDDRWKKLQEYLLSIPHREVDPSPE
jgi:hypothetical protein